MCLNVKFVDIFAVYGNSVGLHLFYLFVENA